MIDSFVHMFSCSSSTVFLVGGDGQTKLWSFTSNNKRKAQR